MDKVRELPDDIVIDWDAMQKAWEEKETFTGPPIEIKINFDLIDKEVEDAMKCVMIVPERKYG